MKVKTDKLSNTKAFIITEAEEKNGFARTRFSLAAMHLVLFLLMMAVLRVVLLVQFKPDSVSVTTALQGYLIGLHLDLFVALLATLPLIFWLALLPDARYRARWHNILMPLGFFLVSGVQMFLTVVEYYFFEEFKSRYNTVAVDYLLYPTEVFTNIWQSYPLLTVVAFCALFGGGMAYVCRRLMQWTSPVTTSVGSRWAMAGAVAMITVTLGLTVNFKAVHFSHERTINEIAGNGQIAFFNAAFTRHLDYSAFYRTLPREEAWKRARRLVAGSGEEFTGGPYSLQRKVPGDATKPRLNVIIILEESLGSEFWGVLGAGYGGNTNGFMPRMDKLAREEGMLFTNLFASGNRTVRGLEGVLASFPPLPGDSIVVRQQSEHVETIGRILKRDGYSTAFLYGGRSLFDNMGTFAGQNGYDRCIEQKDFPKPAFTTAWGVCDEDLFDRVIEECRTLHQSGQPFLATALTVSNHKPFTYPTGRIPEDPTKRWRHHAVKYTDYALGRFFDAVRKEPFFTNTIFAVVADHGARVYGSQAIPMHSYKIPLLVVGPAVAPTPSRVGALGCSLDVSPTILGMIGRPYETTFIGRDLFKTGLDDQRVMLHHNREIGMFRHDRMVVLGMMNAVEFYHGDPRSVSSQIRAEQPDAEDLELERDATALYQVADELYMDRRYKVVVGEKR